MTGHQPAEQENKELKLTVESLSLDFGGVRALDQVSLHVGEKEILAVIGPNGAGKTCLLNCISGFYRPQQGRIHFGGREITSLPRHKIARLGIARSFQNLGLFPGLSTLDNLLTARHSFIKSGIGWQMIFYGKSQREEMVHRRFIEEEIMDFLELQPVRYELVGRLPYGLRKRVELGKVLALEPKILLLDEPMAGMNLEEKEDLARYILDTRDLKKIPILMIEHDMGVVMDIADRIVVLEYGRKIAEGKPDEIKADGKVIKAYLGDEA